MEMLTQIGYLPPLFYANSPLCEHFQYGKQRQNPHVNYATHKHPLNLVHSDVCNLMLTSSVGCTLYFITLINDAT